jgi:PhzF family phenazine biosynthesis protein
MPLPLFVVDAFTAEPFRGNPAAVVLLETAAPEAWMQQVAAEMKHSETAFVVVRPDGAFDLRWFTPTAEVDLCGHATLAGAHTLWETGTLAAGAVAIFHTRSGELRATPVDGGIELDFPATTPEPIAPIPGLLEALGLADAPVFRAGDFYVVVEAPDAAAVRALAPDFAALRTVDGVRAVVVTARDDGEDDFVSRAHFISRVFGPNVGIDEDPVTGSSHCVLGPFWSERLGTKELNAYQASARGGAVRVRIDGDRAYLAGTAVTVVSGALRAMP